MKLGFHYKHAFTERPKRLAEFCSKTRLHWHLKKKIANRNIRHTCCSITLRYWNGGLIKISYCSGLGSEKKTCRYNTDDCDSFGQLLWLDFERKLDRSHGTQCSFSNLYVPARNRKRKPFQTPVDGSATVFENIPRLYSRPIIEQMNERFRRCWPSMI